jgi:hypothetical protein
MYVSGRAGSTGGWPADEVAFPGWGGGCGIAEVSGERVASDPRAFFDHFLLPGRPAIIRDFVRFDTEVRPLLPHSGLIHFVRQGLLMIFVSRTV